MFDKAEAENTKLLRQIDKREKVVHELKQYMEYLKRHFATSFEPKSTGAVGEPDLFSFTNSQTTFSANLTISNQIMTNDQLSNNFAGNFRDSIPKCPAILGLVSRLLPVSDQNGKSKTCYYTIL